MTSAATAIILAGGLSSRMGFNKLTFPLGGRTALEWSLLAFRRAGIRDMVLAVSPATQPEAERLADLYGRAGMTIRLVQGGDTRGDSVYNALQLAQGAIVAIHDGARCLVCPAVIQSSLAGAEKEGSGIAGLPARDTIWYGGDALPRDGLFIAQTPQSFARAKILAAYEAARAEGYTATDDAALYRRHFGEINFTSGSPRNQKLTTPEDIPLFQALLRPSICRVGYGEDTHVLVPGRALVLGGKEIPFYLGLLGHSDADVLTHAAIDALLGAAALGDIGMHFPDTDSRYKDVCSLELMERVTTMLTDRGYLLRNLDATIVAQKPKLAPYIPLMRENLARVLGCAPECRCSRSTANWAPTRTSKRPESAAPRRGTPCWAASQRCV